MKPRGRPKSELLLTPAERGGLLETSRRRKNRGMARRARIVMRCARGQPNYAVAKAEKVSVRTVAKWRERFVELRLRGLADAPRTGAPRKISDAVISRVVQLTVAGREQTAETVSLRSLAHVCGLSRDAVHRIWRSLGLDAQAAVALANDATATEPGKDEVSDVAGLLLHPLGHALALATEHIHPTSGRTITTATGLLPGISFRSPGGLGTSRQDLMLLAVLARTGANDPGTPLESANQALARWLDRLDHDLSANFRIRLLLHGFAGGRHLEAWRGLRHRQRFEIHYIPSHLGWLAHASRWLARGRECALRLLCALAETGDLPSPDGSSFVAIAPSDMAATKLPCRPADESESSPA